MFDTIKLIREKDPAAKSFMCILLFYSGLHAIYLHRIAHKLHKIKNITNYKQDNKQDD